MAKKILSVIWFVLFLSVPCFSLSLMSGMEAFHYVKPGEITSGKITLRNPSAERAIVNLYLQDYQFKSDGTNQFSPPGSFDRSNGKWLTFSPDRLEIAPGEIAHVDYKIVVPENEELNGAYWTMLMIHPIDASDPTVTGLPGENKPISAVQTQFRYAFQILTTVKKNAELKLRFGRREVIKSESGKVFEFDVENIGNLYTRPKVVVELYLNGKPISAIKITDRQILPGCSVRYSADLSKFSPGAYTALIVLDTGATDMVGGRFEINL